MVTDRQLGRNVSPSQLHNATQHYFIENVFVLKSGFACEVVLVECELCQF